MSSNKNDVSAPDIVRLEVNLNRETADALQSLSDSGGVSITEVIRRSIGVYKFLKDEVDSGKEIRTRDHKGREKEIIFIN